MYRSGKRGGIFVLCVDGILLTGNSEKMLSDTRVCYPSSWI